MPVERHAAAGAGDRQRDREVAAGLVDAHAADDVDEHVRAARADAAVAAEDREHERQAVAVEARDDAARLLELRRRDQRLHLDEQRPRALHRRQHDAAGRARRLGDEARRGVEHLDQAALAHLEQARLVGRAEAVLQRAQLAVGALALALELQHAVDEVLEHARAGQRALLGHVPDEDHGGAARLGELHDPRRRPRAPARPSPARPTARPSRSVCTESITQAAGRFGGERGEHRLEVGLGEDRDLQRARGRGARRAAGPARPTPRR